MTRARRRRRARGHRVAHPRPARLRLRRDAGRGADPRERRLRGLRGGTGAGDRRRTTPSAGATGRHRRRLPRRDVRLADPDRRGQAVPVRGGGRRMEAGPGHDHLRRCPDRGHRQRGDDRAVRTRAARCRGRLGGRAAGGRAGPAARPDHRGRRVPHHQPAGRAGRAGHLVRAAVRPGVLVLLRPDRPDPGTGARVRAAWRTAGQQPDQPVARPGGEPAGHLPHLPPDGRRRVVRAGLRPGRRGGEPRQQRHTSARGPVEDARPARLDAQPGAEHPCRPGDHRRRGGTPPRQRR